MRNAFSFLLRKLHSIPDDTRGLAVIEAAFAIPIVVTLALGTYDVSNMISHRQDLEQIAQATASLAEVQRPSGNDLSYLIAEAREKAGTRASYVTATIYSTCAGQRQAYDYNCPATSERAIYINILLAGTYTSIFGGTGILPSSYTIVGDSDVRIQ